MGTERPDPLPKNLNHFVIKLKRNLLLLVVKGSRYFYVFSVFFLVKWYYLPNLQGGGVPPLSIRLLHSAMDGFLPRSPEYFVSGTYERICNAAGYPRCQSVCYIQRMIHFCLAVRSIS